MKHWPVVGMGLLAIAFTVFGCASMSGLSDAGWITLIDGPKGLDYWNRLGDANWRAEDGAIVADKGKGGFLVSEELLQGLSDPGRVLGGRHHEQRDLHTPFRSQQGSTPRTLTR